ncbi:DUF4381 domain-containing protein [Magnetococcales bacterium HHB-1]
MDKKDLLAKLHDITPYEPVSFWPLAPGWWILFLLLMIGVGFWFWLKRKPKIKEPNWSEVLERELDHILSKYPKASAAQLAALNVLLKREAIRRFGRQQVAALHGERWLHFLDQKMAMEPRTFQKHGKILIEGPYQAQVSYDQNQLIEIIRRWLLKN